MKRIGLLVFYDKDGIVDDYLTYFLDHFISFLDDFLIVCNGSVKNSGFIKLQKYTSKIYFRLNRGFDGGAYKEIIGQNLDHIKEFDELILLNDTFFGPFYPLSDMFGKMDSLDIDFWGITRHPKTPTYAEHLQSYFLAIRSRILRSQDFIDFWEGMQSTDNFDAAVANFEVHFTEFFSQKGYCWKSYVDSTRYDSQYDLNLNYNQNYYKTADLIQYYHDPFLKKKDFSLNSEGRVNLISALGFVKNSTNYDVNLIWKTLLRKYNLYDLYESLNLNCIFQENQACVNEKNYSKAAVVILVTADEHFLSIREYMRKIPSEIKIYLYLNNGNRGEELVEQIKADTQIDTAQVSFCKNIEEGKEIWNILAAAGEDNQYICFVHDDVIRSSEAHTFVCDESFNALWENCLASPAYIANIIEYFEQNDSLGILASPFLFHTFYSYTNPIGWHQRFDNYKSIADLWKITSNLDEYKPPRFYASTFWCRNKLWKQLMEALSRMKDSFSFFDLKEMDVLAVLFPYLTQSMGYYTMNLYTDKYASMALAQRERQIREQQESQGDIRSHYEEVLNANRQEYEEYIKQLSESKNSEIQRLSNVQRAYKDIVINQMKTFFENNEEVYIYGTGIIGNRVFELIHQLEFFGIRGFVVTEKKQGQDDFRGHRIYSLDEITNTQAGMILAVNQTNLQEILPKLKKRGFRHFYCYAFVGKLDPALTELEEFNHQITELNAAVDFRNKLIQKKDHEIYVKSLALEAAPFEYGESKIKIFPAENLLEKLINERLSLSRFGDGEFALIQNEERPWFQRTNETLGERLDEVLNSDRQDLLVAIPDIFGSLKQFKEGDRTNIRHFLSGGERERILKLLDSNKTYYDAYVSRPYLMYQDKKHGERIFNLFKRLWKGRDILLVEGKFMRTGVRNDLFAGANSLRRILCPAENAFDYYEEIEETVLKYGGKSDLILIGLGPTATVLSYDISAKGYQAIDVGQIDNEYEWFLMQAEERMPILGKAVPELQNEHEAGECVDSMYESQIIARIGC